MVIVAVGIARRLEKTLIFGPGKKNSRRRCHVYPFNKSFAATTGHAGLRKHKEVKEQGLEALRQRCQGKKNVSFTLNKNLWKNCSNIFDD